ncbi:MAG: hypothetical protein ACYDAG_08410, partial [Chloroflexota bacterium]
MTPSNTPRAGQPARVPGAPPTAAATTTPNPLPAYFAFPSIGLNPEPAEPISAVSLPGFGDLLRGVLRMVPAGTPEQGHLAVDLAASEYNQLRSFRNPATAPIAPIASIPPAVAPQAPPAATAPTAATGTTTRTASNPRRRLNPAGPAAPAALAAVTPAQPASAPESLLATPAGPAASTPAPTASNPGEPGYGGFLNAIMKVIRPASPAEAQQTIEAANQEWNAGSLKPNPIPGSSTPPPAVPPVSPTAVGTPAGEPQPGHGGVAPVSTNPLRWFNPAAATVSPAAPGAPATPAMAPAVAAEPDDYRTFVRHVMDDIQP